MVAPDGSVIGVTQGAATNLALHAVVRLRNLPLSEHGEFASCAHPGGGVDIDCLMSRRFSAFSDYDGESSEVSRRENACGTVVICDREVCSDT